MIDDLIEWCDWDQFDSFVSCYYGCTMKANIGDNIKVGDTFELINVDYEDGIIEFFAKEDDDQYLYKYNMKLTFEL